MHNKINNEQQAISQSERFNTEPESSFNLLIRRIIVTFIIIYLTPFSLTAQQTQSLKSNNSKIPYGISMSKLFGVWQSIDTFHYKIEFTNLNTGFVLKNVDTPYYYFKDSVNKLPAISSPFVPFYFSSDSTDIAYSVGYFPGQPQWHFLLDFIAKDTLSIRYSLSQIEMASILYSRK